MKLNHLIKQPTIERLLQQAVDAYHAGDFRMARHRCEKVLEHDEHNADAYHFIGLSCLKSGDVETALSMVDAAIRENPMFSDFHRSMARILKVMGRLDHALISYHKAVSINPDDLTSIYEAGVLNQQLGNFDAAERCYHFCLFKNPVFKECYNNLGLLYKANGKLPEAIACLKKAIKIDPFFAKAFNNLGIAHKERGELSSALLSFRAATKANPQYAEAFYNQGIVLSEQGKNHEAIASYRQALRIKPNLIDVHNNLGVLLNKQGHTDDALRSLEEAIRLDPGNANAYLNAGIIYYHQGKLNRAIKYTRSAIEKKPEDVKGHFNYFEQLRAGCCWDELKDVERKIDRLTDEALNSGNLPNESPFLSITRSDDRQRNMKIACYWSQEVKERCARMGQPYRYDIRPKETITIGFLSNRFRNAATGHLMAGMFRYFNRKRFKVHCYSWGDDDGSYFRKSIEKGCDRFIDISDTGLVAAADLINAEKVDILLDLKGFTRNNRMEIFALRPAPIQIAYLNYNSTSGADFIDYIIGDSTVTPKRHLTNFSEKVVVMPHTHMVTDTGLTIGKKKDRKTEKLPDDSIVFCSFNQAYKIEPRLFNCWMTILQRVDHSVLWLLHDNDLAVKNLKREARKHGIDPQRLIFAPKVNKRDHLSRLRLADIVLDTWLCNGHTTTVDALLSSVPVITKEGRHFPSRVASSLIRAIGLETLVCIDRMEYMQKAIQLATHSRQLSDIKNLLSKNKLTHPLFDTKRFVRNLEDGLEKAWGICLAGEKPRHIYVQDEY